MPTSHTHTHTVKEFFTILFKKHHGQNYTPEPNTYPHDLRVAISTLRHAGRLNMESLAVRVPGATTPSVNAWEYRGGPIKWEQLEKLSGIAMEFGLPKLAQWFYMRAITMKRTSRGKGRIMPEDAFSSRTNDSGGTGY